jgi:hypothetical protein
MKPPEFEQRCDRLQLPIIHDFQAFAGLTPSAYLAELGEHHNHAPLPG